MGVERSLTRTDARKTSDQVSQRSSPCSSGLVADAPRGCSFSFFVLSEAIRNIRRPLEYCAKHDFANIERLRDLERTISQWKDSLAVCAFSPHQEAILLEFCAAFYGYDAKPTPQKINTIQRAFALLNQLEQPPEHAMSAVEEHDDSRSTLSVERDESDAPRPGRRRAADSVHSTPSVERETSVAADDADEHPESSDAAPEERQQLGAPLQYIKGIGPKRAKLLERLGVKTIEDALFFFPRRYEDRRHIEKIVRLRPSDRPTTVYGVVRASGVTVSPKQHAKIFELMIGDDTGVFTAKWFNQGFLKKVFTPGIRVVLSGKITMKRYGGLEMIQPEYEIISADEGDDAKLLHTGRIVPIYPLTDGLYQKEMRKIMKQIVDQYAASVEETLPDALRRTFQFLPLHHALRQIHFPEQTDNIELLNQEKSPAHQRLIFDEFFLLELGMGLRQHHVSAEEPGIAFTFNGTLERYLRASLGFSLTSAQNRVIQEIQENMRSTRVMNRLLQGDVGSGKTLVALVALLSAIEAGFQGAIMVPTEILAEQHYRKIAAYVQHLNQQIQQGDLPNNALPKASEQPDLYSGIAPREISVALLTGGMKKREREETLLKIERGEIDMVVGTHALLQHDVTFHQLGLIVIDEQHKFGVMQRATLKAKGYNPDVLIMTATPIPRTLSLTMYGDLDVSILDELPPGRTPVMTRRFYEKDREKAYRLIEREIERGRQVYIVYPLVEESENLDLKAATEMSEHLAKDIFPQYRIGLVHGRLKSEEKERQMQAFKAHELHILVSTTVLEVGIDVPNATVMLIEHAERFGLSQLHQLRGRVGRGAEQSYCLLMTSFPISEDARKRLDAMVETTDGFVIAERDLEIRGPGEFFGTKQSGLPDLNVANLVRDVKLLEQAREEAFALIQRDPALELPQHRRLKHALEQRWKKSLDLISVG